MRMRYYISTKENLLYGSKFYYQGRFQSYGQHSFIYDFLINAYKQNIKVDLIVDEIKNFPIYKIIQPYCTLVEWRKAGSLETADIAIVDVICERMTRCLPVETPKICIVHNAGTLFNRALIEMCNCFICMTETAWNFQVKTIPSEKLVLIHQGVDLKRFRRRNELFDLKQNRNLNILIYTRMNQDKRNTIFSVLNELKTADYYVTVLGSGPLFWEFCDLFGDRFVIINYIPYHSIPIFLQQFDLIISSGRGVMESCASGKPTICAGLGYGGLITRGNVKHLLKRNLTGYGENFSAAKFKDDIKEALSIRPMMWREIAESYFDVNLFIKKIKYKISEITSVLN